MLSKIIYLANAYTSARKLMENPRIRELVWRAEDVYEDMSDGGQLVVKGAIALAIAWYLFL